MVSGEKDFQFQVLKVLLKAKQLHTPIVPLIHLDQMVKKAAYKRVRLSMRFKMIGVPSDMGGQLRWSILIKEVESECDQDPSSTHGKYY